MIAGIPWGYWAGFILFVLSMLALDLGVFHRQAHEVKMKEALTWSAVWISVALLFNVALYFFWDVIHAPGYQTLPAGQAAQLFLTGFLVEKALSVDNIFVILVIFNYFRVPGKYQHRVLFWGILGALFFRAVFIGAGVTLIQQFTWTMLIFGGFLIYTGIKMVGSHEAEVDPSQNPVVKAFRKIVPVTDDFHGKQFWTRIDGKLWATPLMVCLIMIEFTDIIFAVDSIPAILAITTDPFIVFTSNVFAILGLRALFFAVAGLVRMFHYLSYGLAAILVFVGAKMLYAFAHETWLHDWPKFPVGLSLAIILGVLGLSILMSFLKPAPPEHVVDLPEGTDATDLDAPGDEVKSEKVADKADEEGRTL